MFNLENVQENKTSATSTNYQKPGISDNVVVAEVELKQTSKNNVDYMELRTKSSDGALGKSNKMFFGQDVKPGKKMSGWDVTAKNINSFIQATHNVDYATAKQLFGNPQTPTDVVSKVASLLVGRPFRGKFKGETSATGMVYASLDSVESVKVPKTESRLSFNPDKDIKPYQAYEGSTTDAVNANTGTEEKSDLPF